MKPLFNLHFFSQLVKYGFGLVALLLSAILSYTFFKGIQPQGMDVFPFAALSLTELGLIAWLFVFRAQRHDPIKGMVALIMVAACFVTTITITFAELIQLFQDHSLIDNATVQNGVLILLEVMLGLHVLAIVGDFVIDRVVLLLDEMKTMQHPSTIVEATPSRASTPVQLPQQASSANDTEYQQFLTWKQSQNGHVKAQDEAKK